MWRCRRIWAASSRLKFRSGVLYRIFEQTGDRPALEESLKQYRAARSSWASWRIAPKGVTVVPYHGRGRPQLRGHWLDRLPAIDADIAAVESEARKRPKPADRSRVRGRDPRGAGPAARRRVPSPHNAADHSVRASRWSRAFCREKAGCRYGLLLSSCESGGAIRVRRDEMQGHATGGDSGNLHDSHYPLQYYFEVTESDATSLYPGSDWSDRQLDFVVRKQG